ncbi:hypothetical protein KAJ83_01570 [Marivibrio halodurans]|uniref:Uncharacterized protein n=1 Tax=Marivibrio halodurans TaxID=2039722 RepID=A0A8J7SKR1_9PROT|nr:hypothetical protein [Marivibrio halodurans]MBP5855681.1 hypothetical protein [Marivibrio halodurans]
MAISTGAALAISAVTTAVGSFASYKQAQNAADMRKDAARREANMAEEVAMDNFARQQEELTERQEQVDEASEEKKSDLARKADAEFAALQAQMASGGGVLGTTNALRIANEQRYLQGVDVGRIERQRQREIDALQKDKEAVSQETANAINRGNLQVATTSAEAEMAESNARTSAMMDTLNSGVQIATSYAKHQERLEAAKG